MVRSIAILITLLITVTVYANPASDGGVLQSDRLRQLLERVDREPAVQMIPVTVILELPEDVSTPASFATLGAEVRFQRGPWHEVVLPQGRLRALLGRLPAGTLARFPYPHQALNTVISQGVELTGGESMQLLGYTGLGRKIGVIDLGFGGLAASQDAGELQSDLVVQDYTGSGTGGTNHGTNVAEIVHDMAPDAALYLARIGTEVQLGEAKDDMVAAGVDVIVHSVAWFGAAYYDGTGPICDITDNATASGIQWVNAMGNHRLKHYAGTFFDSTGDAHHEFLAGQGYNTVSVNQGATLTLVLNWDAYPSTAVDYDLFLYDDVPGQGGQEVASSENRQSGKGPSRYPYPMESISYTVPATGTYYIVVSKVVSSDPNLPLTLFSMNHNLDVRTTAGSILQPADCHGVIGTGATNLTDGPESFSSEGPTKDGRPKPEIAAPNRVQTSTTSSFVGTSASAPHAAGAFALLKTQNPGLDNVALRDLMAATAQDVHTAGFDYRTGSGRISLDADQDGLNHDQELLYGTDPLSAESDGDGLSDWDEVFFHNTDPLVADSDGDGFKDGIEVSYGSDPLDPDVIPDLVFGDLNGDGLVDIIDVLLARRIVLGQLAPTEDQMLHGDVAPLVNGKPRPNGIMDLGDLLLIQRKALGAVDY